MSALGQKRTFWPFIAMSALPPKADILAVHRHVRFTPKSGHWNSAAQCPLCAKSRHSALRQRTSFFDHLVGASEH
jgi:hypothetical protein